VSLPPSGGEQYFPVVGYGWGVFVVGRIYARVYLADAKPEERSALRLLLDLKMEVVGEAADWSTTLARAPVSRTDMLLVDLDLLLRASSATLEELRKACPAALVIVLVSHLDACHQAGLSDGADSADLYQFM
jgi:DNA-binding NarL/FixJ family response regulator